MSLFINGLIKIKNASVAKHDEVEIKASKLLKAVVDIMQREGYISGYELKNDGNKSFIRVHLKYAGENKETPVLHNIKFVSKPGRRVYMGKEDIPRYMNGLATVIVSTSSGVITGKKAKKLGVGGEVLCYMW